MSLIDTLTDLARRAGHLTLGYFQMEELAVETKSDDSPVTIADRETEQFIRKEVARLFPGDVVIGEEFGEGPGAAGARRWIVDPIDGTKSFLHGVPLYGVMIGIEENGEMIAGAVNIPALGDLVVAERGHGCIWNGKQARVSRTTRVQDALVLTTDIKNNYKYGRGAAWDRITEKARIVRTWGDCYGHLLVATGRADIMLDPIMNPWDCAALLPILEEAGGTFTDYDGKATVYGSCAISTNGRLKDEVLSLVKA
jgi:histidinol phosphatase-like enzyme (inositol monophosphatase family)